MASFLRSSSIVVLLVTMTTARLCPPADMPDGLATAPFVSGAPGDLITLDNVKILVNGQQDYPVSVKQPIQLTGKVSVGGTDTYHDLKAHVRLAQLKLPIFQSKCAWVTIPTFGLLNHIDEPSSTPIAPGTDILNTTIDLSKYATIIDLFAHGDTLQGVIELTSGDAGNTLGRKLATVTAEFTISK